MREIQYLALHERVYDEIRRSLIAGQFEPGQKVSSRKLAAVLGTSDMPVRTALSRLIAEGGLLRRANNTICVPTCSRKSFTELMDLRVVLEGHATRLACGHVTDEDFRELEKCSEHLNEAIRAENVSQYLDWNRKLKFTIYKQCGSDTLLAMLAMTWLKVGPFLRHLSPTLKSISAINFHSEAIAALKHSDAAAAADAIERDIRAGRDRLLQAAQFDEDDSTVEASPVALP